MTKNGKLTSDNTFCPAASDTRKVLLKAGFSASDADLFTERLTELLNDYTAAFGEGTKFQYTVWKNAVKVELRITIPGEKFDPFSEGDGAKKRTYENIFSANPDTGSSVMTYRYKMRCNLISIAISRPEKPKKLINDVVIIKLLAIFPVTCHIFRRTTNQSKHREHQPFLNNNQSKNR